jgi:hypothetical protein
MGRRVVVVALAATACGRVGFSEQTVPGDGGSDGSDGNGGTPVAFVDNAKCASPIDLTLVDGAAAGETLIVAFFMRAPMPNDPPTISGGGLAWQSDLAVSSSSSINRRTFAIFTASVQATIAPGTVLSVAHPVTDANGGVLFKLPATISQVGAVVANEGNSPPFTGSITTTAQRIVCAVVHHNQASATFEAPFQGKFDFNVDCGSTRESAGVHLSTAVNTGGAIDCTGGLDSNFSWLVVMAGYDGLDLGL